MFTNTKAFSGFAVDDVDKAREFYGDTLGLKTSVENGILTLEIAGEYEGFDQDDRGIHRVGPPIAWFKDPAGNVLSVIQVD
jgi:catechol 2,3-dioxygenase-like lactoylglutathione lyase family enzyme